ncbi:hypothetical protein B0H13DRAFT_1850478 [Mycena leptocephala]|nr:hypothetical protein B0H13DRAFT_1850478 [Mycena leptocephala]
MEPRSDRRKEHDIPKDRGAHLSNTKCSGYFCPNAEPELRFRFRDLLNLEPEPGVQVQTVRHEDVNWGRNQTLWKMKYAHTVTFFGGPPLVVRTKLTLEGPRRSTIDGCTIGGCITRLPLQPVTLSRIKTSRTERFIRVAPIGPHECQLLFISKSSGRRRGPRIMIKMHETRNALVCQI